MRRPPNVHENGFRLQNTRVQVVEDSPLIPEFLKDLLDELGCKVIGPAPSMAVALKLAAEEMIDIAVIDVNIRGAKVFPVADLLADRLIPFVFVTGYASWQVPEKHRMRQGYKSPTHNRRLRTA